MHKKYLATGSKVQLHPQCPQLRSFSRKYPRNNWGVWIVGRVIVWQIGWDGSNRTLHSTLKHIYMRRNWESPSQPASQPDTTFTNQAGWAGLAARSSHLCLQVTQEELQLWPARPRQLLQLYFTLYTLRPHQLSSPSCSRYFYISGILESLSIDRVGRFWVPAKIWETFTCLSRQWWFLEHEYIVKSTLSRYREEEDHISLSRAQIIIIQ